MHHLLDSFELVALVGYDRKSQLYLSSDFFGKSSIVSVLELKFLDCMRGSDIELLDRSEHHHRVISYTGRITQTKIVSIVTQ